jgi:hypothetical protein
VRFLDRGQEIHAEVIVFSPHVYILAFYPFFWLYPFLVPCGKTMSFSFFFTDNEVLISVINNQTSRDNWIMHIVRFMGLQLNLLFKARHIPNKKNVLADSLFCLRVHHFLKLCTFARKQPGNVP